MPLFHSFSLTANESKHQTETLFRAPCAFYLAALFQLYPIDALMVDQGVLLHCEATMGLRSFSVFDRN